LTSVFLFGFQAGIEPVRAFLTDCAEAAAFVHSYEMKKDTCNDVINNLPKAA